MKKLLGIFVLGLAFVTTGCNGTATKSPVAPKHQCTCVCGCKDGLCDLCCTPDSGVSVKIGGHGEFHSSATKCAECTCTAECCAECCAAAKARNENCSGAGSNSSNNPCCPR